MCCPNRKKYTISVTVKQAILCANEIYKFHHRGILFGGSAVWSKPTKLIDIGYEAHSVFLFDVVGTFRFWYWNLKKKSYLAPRNLCISFARLFHT
jgi:hypothetical protein